MKHILLVLWCAAAPVLAAQHPPDTSEQAQTQQLRQQVRQRWQQVVRTQLGLTPDQATKLQATEDRFAAQRRDIAQRQRGVQEALRGQLQPGVAANADSVRRLVDARDQNRATLAQIDRDEDQEIAGYLSPVQRARYQIMRQRLEDRIAEMRRQRRQQLMGPRGARPGVRRRLRP